MKFRVQIQCKRCPATAETWVEGYQHRGEATCDCCPGSKTDLWEIVENAAELPEGWQKLWDQHYHEHFIVCLECA